MGKVLASIPRTVQIRKKKKKTASQLSQMRMKPKSMLTAQLIPVGLLETFFRASCLSKLEFTVPHFHDAVK